MPDRTLQNRIPDVASWWAWTGTLYATNLEVALVRGLTSIALIAAVFASVGCQSPADGAGGWAAAPSHPGATTPDAGVTEWADVLEVKPDATVIPDVGHRAAIEKTGLPWRVRDKGSGIEMLLLPPGQYVRGASAGDSQAEPNEKPARHVTIAEPFYLGRYEVTNAQFRQFRPTHDSGVWNEHSMRRDNQPVVLVYWDAAVAYLDSYGLRLPTEDEWEYAARAGTTGARYGDLDAIAWCAMNSGDQSHPVGQKLANRFGLHDMIGGVWEWCSDAWPESPDDPEAPGPPRVMRGGSWFDQPWYCRVSARGGQGWKGRDSHVGFRAARTPFGRAPVPSRATADISDPHEVAREVVVDPGPYASCLSRRYVVVEGDTWASVATRECGDPGCIEDLRLLNPAIQAEELRAGARMVLPPGALAAETRAEERSETRPSWVLFQFVPSFKSRGVFPRPEPLVAGDPSRVAELGAFQCYLLVPRDRIAAFLRFDWPRGLSEPQEFVVVSEHFFPSGLADDPVVRITTHVTLREVKDRKLAIDVIEKHYDSGGRLVFDQRSEPLPPPPPRHK
jgi:formylglycine-generating enzyme required for sulfatase activity